jgi:hypothetical protein
MIRNFQKLLNITGISSTYFTEDENIDIAILGFPIFELDENDYLMPTISGTEDPFFEINIDNEITIKP